MPIRLSADFSKETLQARRGWKEIFEVMKSETKENVQGTNSEWKESRTQINRLEQKEERNIQPEQNEETRTPKTEGRLRKLQDIFKRSNIRIIGVPEREEEEQGIENIMENFPNLAKEIDFQEFQKTQKSQKS